MEHTSKLANPATRDYVIILCNATWGQLRVVKLPNSLSSSMFRAIVSRATRRPFITTVTRLSSNYPLRWNSSQANGSLPLKREKTPEMLAKKAALEREDDLQRDWDAKVVSYVELLPKTQSPSPVSQDRVFV